MKLYKVAVVKGDGIGPEVTGAAVKTLKAAGAKFGFEFEFLDAPMGGAAYDEFGLPYPEQSRDLCRISDAVLLGAVGGEKWNSLPVELRPEQALFSIRKDLGLYANLRPAVLFEPLKSASPLRGDIVENGFDFVVVRELTGGLYYGKRALSADAAYDTMSYKKDEIERLAKIGFDLARRRKKRVCSVDKANVLDCSRLWRATVREVAKDYPDVELSELLVDNAAMQLVRRPAFFDVIITENMFGDILTDEAGALTGSIGMLASASVGGKGPFLYEPIHGSAPDIAGKGIANPLASILSAAMMLRMTFEEEEAARAVEGAVAQALAAGARTADIAGSGEAAIGTEEMTREVISRL